MLKHDYADVNGIRLHYVSDGSGDLMVFWHGNFTCWYEWKAQLAEFSKDHHVVAFDLRGYNLSSRPTDPQEYHPKTIVEDVRQLIEHLGYKKCTLVGHDNNGIPFIFGSFHPEYLEKLIIINAPHPTMITRHWLEHPEQKEASQYVLTFQSPDAERIYSENNFAVLINQLFSKVIEKGDMSEDDLKMYRELWSQPGALTAAFNYYRVRSASALSGAQQRPTRPLMIYVPTLVIWGEQHEMLLPGLIDGLEEYIPDLAIKRFPDVQSMIHEKPDVLNQLIQEFIEVKK